MNVIIVITIFIAILVMAEIVRKFRISNLVSRKLAHVAGGILTALLPLLVSRNWAIGIGLLFSILILVAVTKGFLPGITGLGKEKTGAVIFPLSLVVCALFFWSDVSSAPFSVAALTLGLADGLGGLAGRTRAGKEFTVTGPKTYFGSAVFFLVSFVIALGFSSFASKDLASVFVFALGTTVIEAVVGKGLDNLAVPLVAGALFKILFP